MLYLLPIQPGSPTHLLLEPTSKSKWVGEPDYDLCCNFLNFATSPGEERKASTLRLVQIYFDTATFDDIERDKKIKTEAQLSLIGGTMGLLTGFSIISGIEIVFLLFRFIPIIILTYKMHWSWKQD